MEVERESGLQGQLNPLLIPHILENVMAYTSFEDLKSSRLVCRSWEETLNRVFRDKGVINFETVEQLTKFNFTMEAESPLLVNYRLGPGMPIQSEPFINFYRKFGNSIRSLHFKNCDWAGTGSMLRKVLEGLPMLHELQLDLTPSFTHVITSANHLRVDLLNLKSLTMDTPVRSPAGEWYGVEAEQFFYNFLTHTPNLESIMYTGCIVEYLPKDFYECYSCKLIFGLIVKEDSIKLRNLKTFDVIRRCIPNELKMLEAKRFPLQNLHLILYEVSQGLTSTSLCSLLLSLRDTLRRLTLVFINEVDFSHKKFNCFQQLKKLEYFTLEGCHGCTSVVRHPPSLPLLKFWSVSEVEREVIKPPQRRLL